MRRANESFSQWRSNQQRYSDEITTWLFSRIKSLFCDVHFCVSLNIQLKVTPEAEETWKEFIVLSAYLLLVWLLHQTVQNTDPEKHNQCDQRKHVMSQPKRKARFTVKVYMCLTYGASWQVTHWNNPKATLNSQQIRIPNWWLRD